MKKKKKKMGKKSSSVSFKLKKIVSHIFTLSSVCTAAAAETKCAELVEAPTIRIPFVL